MRQVYGAYFSAVQRYGFLMEYPCGYVIKFCVRVNYFDGCGVIFCELIKKEKL